MPDPQGGVVTTLTGTRQTPGYSFGFYGAGDPVRPIVDGQTPRQWDFAPGVNTTYSPRHTEPFNFRHLRAFSNVELVRMAIETRKDQLERLDWTIKPKDNKKARASDRDPRCVEVEKFLAKPNGVDHFAVFFRALEEDLLALDAPCLECIRTRGGKLAALELVDGATINLLVDDTGRRPRGDDAVAFQQIIRGNVWTDLTNRQLLYAPRNPRTGHIYGYGPVEQIIVTINMILRRQSSQLAYFTEGSIPAGFMTAPENWNNEQIKDLQEWWNQGLAGNQAERKVLWGPAGAKYQNFKDALIKDDFDEWLARLVAFAFSLPPTPFIRQMNKGTAGEDQDRALEEGLEPLKQWRKRLIDQIIAEEFGYSDVEFAWREERTIDPKEQADIDNLGLRNGSITLDEARDNRGQDPLPDGLGSKARIYMTTGVLPLELIDATAAAGAAPSPNPADMPAAGGKEPAGGPPSDDPTEVKPPEPEHAKVAKANRAPSDDALALSVDRPKALRAAAALKRAIVPILAKASHDIAAQVERSLEKAERDPDFKAKKIADSLDLSLLFDLQDPLEEELQLIAEDAAGLALASVGADAGELVDRVNVRAVEWAKERAAELVSLDGDESLIASTRDMIRQIIAGGLAENVGRDAIAENIQDATAFSTGRAELIANTEIAKANGAAKGAAWAEVQADGAQMVKEWFASADEGVCDICEGNDDQGEIAFGESFESGDDMEPAHPACRCVVVARVLDQGEAADA
jgi:SPP1 gp7 family putative phage head morphogenesis protein